MSTISTFDNRLKMLLEYFQGRGKTGYYPQEMVIELTNHCNLACVMCPHKNMTREKGFMDEDLFGKIVDEISGKTELIYLYGTGESLLNKKLYHYTRYAKSRGLTTCLSTNGLLMDREASIKLVSCDLDYLIIALDGGVKETYESIRIKGDFDKLIANIKLLLQMKAQASTITKICLQMIYMEQNSNEVKLFKKIFTSTERRAVDQFRFKPLYKTYALEKESVVHTRPCYWLWNMMSIYWNGDVALCCMDSDAAYNFGNVGWQTVWEIWNSEALRKVRLKHRHLFYCDMPLCNSCDIPEHGYFNLSTILGSALFSAGQVRQLIPLYEKYVLQQFANRFAIKTGI